MKDVTMDKLVEILLAKWKWWVAGLLCGCVAAYAFTSLFMEPVYTSSVALYVQNTTENQEAATTNNLYASRMLTNSYAVILQDAKTLKLAAAATDGAVTAQDIAGALSVKTSEDSAIITVSATTQSKKQSEAICAGFAQMAPTYLPEISGAGTVKCLGGVSSAVQTGPHTTRNILIGGVLGAVLMGLLVLARFLWDTTIKVKEDFTDITDIPVLGEIPSLKSN